MTEIHLPQMGTVFEFVGGVTFWQCMGRCVVTRAEVCPNTAGRPGGRVWFLSEHYLKGLQEGHIKQSARAEYECTVTLSYYRRYARQHLVVHARPPPLTAESEPPA